MESNNIVDKRTNYIELDEFKNKANVYYQQLTKAAPIKGLGSHEHIYFTYGIEWAFNHLPQLKNEYDKLKEQNNSLLEALKEIAVPYPDNMSAEQDNILCKYLIARAEEAILKIKTN